MAGTIVHANTHSPTDQELNSCPHIVLSLPRSWDLQNVKFPSPQRSLEEEIGGLRYISAVLKMGEQQYEEEEETILFNLGCIIRRISSMKVIEPQVLH